MSDALPESTLQRMLELVAPEWELRAADPVEAGFSAVYRLVVDGAPAETYYLKCTVDGDSESVRADARVQRLLEERTEVPVTPIVGVVDEHPDLPAPFHLSRGVPGETLDYETIGEVSDGWLRTLSRDVGRHLGDLHALDAVDSFGYVASGDGTRSGERPVGDPAELTVIRGREDWPPYLRARVGYEMDRHEDSRFDDLTDSLRGWFDERIEALSGPFRPALGRNDHGLHNLLVDAETGSVTTMPDWAYTLAVPPAFDVAYAVYLYGGSFLAGREGVSDRGPLVREALLAGYWESAPELVEQVAEPPACYELMAATRVMNDFEQLRLEDDELPAVEERLREDVRARLAQS